MPVQKTVTYELYEFNELSEKAKEKALQWFLEISCDDDIAENIIEDAELIGLKITDIQNERGQLFTCKGSFKFDIEIVINNILKQHGGICDTHIAATKYLEERKANTANVDDEIEISDWLEKHDDEFLYEILQCYSSMLQKEIEYRQSREYLTESIEANIYTFDENGKRKD